MPFSIPVHYSVCLRCGPHIKACERARGGRKCPVPQMHASGKPTYDALVAAWYEKLRKQRAANFPTRYPTARRDGGDK